MKQRRYRYMDAYDAIIEYFKVHRNMPSSATLSRIMHVHQRTAYKYIQQLIRVQWLIDDGMEYYPAGAAIVIPAYPTLSAPAGQGAPRA